jgi:hypothetical protein
MQDQWGLTNGHVKTVQDYSEITKLVKINKQSH